MAFIELYHKQINQDITLRLVETVGMLLQKSRINFDDFIVAKTLCCSTAVSIGRRYVNITVGA